MTSAPRPVTMIRESDAPFPAFALPAGFLITWYRSGCEEWWYDIQRRSDDLIPITRELFAQTFGDAPDELPRRQCFLLDAHSQPIGTATAWFNIAFRGRVFGRLHWVAIVPEWQGTGLAKPLMSAVCARLRELHPGRSYLKTAAERLPAINLYLKFGFVPDRSDPADGEVWDRILGQLGETGRLPRGDALRSD